MSREVRRVPADWKHPKDDEGDYVPLYGRSFADDLAEWHAGERKWSEGFREDFATDGEWAPREGNELDLSYAEWAGECPQESWYMPDWDDRLRTHYMMYEATSEGTPISPALATPEELARWLANNRASACGDMTATYDQWLAACRAGWAPSAVVIDQRGLISGVEGMPNA